MKTIEQVLEGVTAHERWKQQMMFICYAPPGTRRTSKQAEANDSYAARACSTWPELVRLAASVDAYGRDIGHFGTCCCQRCELWWQAKAALAVALEDQTFFQPTKPKTYD